MDPTARAPVLEGPDHDQRAAQLADVRARAVGVAGVVALFAALAIWILAESLRAVEFPERTTKGWCSAVAGVAALVQLATMVAAGRTRDPQRRLTLVRAHRRSGAIALLTGGFVTYLCFSFGFPPGVTLHRVTGFAVCLAVIAKFALIRARGSLVAAIALLGVVVVIGFELALVTEGIPAIRGVR